MKKMAALLCALLVIVAMPHPALGGSVRPIAVIPFELYSDYILVRVGVNGSGPHDFILDTGASDYFLNRRLAEVAGIALEPLEEQPGLGTGEGTPPISVAKDVTFTLGSIEFPHRTAYSVPVGGLENAIGRPINGIIGADLFTSYVVEIDYASRKLSLFDRRSFRYSGSGSVLPIKLVEDRPFVRAELLINARTRVSGLFIIDTGDGSALNVHTPFVRKHRLPPKGQPVLASVTFGIAGKAAQLIGRVAGLKLGRFVLKAPITAFAQAEKGSTADASYDGAIGDEILKRFKVTLDYSRKRLILEHSDGFDAPFEADMSGFSLIARDPGFSTIEVSRVLENSPAAEAGVHVGDQILTVDGKKAGEYSLETLDELFKVENREFLLTIRRGDKVIDVRLKSRRLI